MNFNNLQFTEEPGCKVHITFDVPAEENSKLYQEKLNQLAKHVQMKGFRKGKAPLNMVEKQYKETLKKDIRDDLIPMSIIESIKSYEKFDKENQSLLSISIVSAGEFEPDKEFHIETKVDITPKIELKKYKGISYKQKEAIVDENEVKEVLERTRERYATYETVESEANENNYVLVDYEGFDEEGKAIPQFKQTNYTMSIASDKCDKDLFKKIKESLAGSRANDEKTLEIVLPDDFEIEKFRNKKILFKIKVIAVKTKKLSELDDEFAKDLEFESLESMTQNAKESIKLKMEEEYSKEAEADFLESLRKENPIENISDYLIEEEYQRRQTAFGKVSKEKYCQVTGKTPEALEEEIRKLSKETVHSSLLLLDIAKKESITVSDEEFAAEIKKIAYYNNMSEEVVIDRLKKNRDLKSLEESILKRKALEFILKNAEIIKS